MDDADFADDGDDGFGGFDLNLGDIAAFGDFLAGFIGSIPLEGVVPGLPAILARGKVPAADTET